MYGEDDKWNEISHFQDTSLIQERLARIWLQNVLQHLTIKSTLYTLSTYPPDPNFDPFHSTKQPFFKTQDCLKKSELQKITPEWPSHRASIFRQCTTGGHTRWAPVLHWAVIYHGITGYLPTSGALRSLYNTTYTCSIHTSHAPEQPRRPARLRGVVHAQKAVSAASVLL